MLKEFSIENWILGGTGFLLIFTLGCYLWFNNEMASIEQNYTDHKVGIQHTEKSTETGHVKAPHIEQIDVEEPDTPEEDSSSAPENTTESMSNANDTQQEDNKRTEQTVVVQSRNPLQITGTQLFSLKGIS